MTCTEEPPIKDPPTSEQPLYNRHYYRTSVQSTRHEWTLVDSRQQTSCVLPTDQPYTTVFLIMDKRETTPFMQEFNIERS